MDTPGVERPKVKLKREPVLTISTILRRSIAMRIAALAETEQRTMSKMVGILIEEALKKRGV
jgi:hypothetical protein